MKPIRILLAVAITCLIAEQSVQGAIYYDPLYGGFLNESASSYALNRYLSYGCLTMNATANYSLSDYSTTLDLGAITLAPNSRSNFATLTLGAPLSFNINAISSFNDDSVPKIVVTSLVNDTTAPSSAVPEPSTLMLLGIATGCAMLGRRVGVRRQIAKRHP